MQPGHLHCSVVREGITWLWAQQSEPAKRGTCLAQQVRGRHQWEMAPRAAAMFQSISKASKAPAASAVNGQVSKLLICVSEETTSVSLLEAALEPFSPRNWGTWGPKIAGRSRAGAKHCSYT